MERRCALAWHVAEAAGMARMRAAIGFEERRPLRRREMAGLEDGVEVLYRDRHRIGRIGDLADEAAILAHDLRQLEAHAGWPLVKHRLENGLVGGDGSFLALSFERRLRHRSPPGSSRRSPASPARARADSSRTRATRSATALLRSADRPPSRRTG